MNWTATIIGGRILLLFLCLQPITAMAQEDCSERLRQAQRQFDNGFPEDVYDLINDCLENGLLGKDEEVQALRLITIVYLYDRNANAEKQLSKIAQTQS